MPYIGRRMCLVVQPPLLYVRNIFTHYLMTSSNSLGKVYNLEALSLICDGRLPTGDWVTDMVSPFNITYVSSYAEIIYIWVCY